MDVCSLPVLILQYVAQRAVQDAGLALAQGGGVFAYFGAAAAGFDADQLDVRLADEGIEHASRVAAAADAGDDDVGQPADLLAALLFRFLADDRLKIAYHHRTRVRPDDAADDVMRVFNARHPVSHRFVDGVAQGSAAAIDGDDLSS